MRAHPIPIVGKSVFVLLLLTGCSRTSTTPSGGSTSGSGTAAVAPSAGPTGSVTPPAASAGSGTVEDLAITPNDDAHPTAQEGLHAVARSAAGSIDWQWSVNGAPLPGSIGDSLAPGKYKKGDVVSVEARARGIDGTVSPPSKKDVKIKNAPPVIVSSAPEPNSGNSYKVTASDPDGDALSYSLDKPVPGVSVGPDGTLTFDPAQVKAAGGVQALVVVKDPDGASVTAGVNLAFH